MTIYSQWQWLWLSKRTRIARPGSWSSLQMTLAGQRSSIWYSSVTGRKYYHLAHIHDFITCLPFYMLTFLHVYLLTLNAYLIAGLLPTMETLFPTVEHRYCVKYIYNNFKVNHKGMELKSVLWRCAGTISAREFERGITILRVWIKKFGSTWLI